MDPLIAFRGNALGNLAPSRQQRTEAFKKLTATYRTQVEAASGRGAAFKAVLAALQKSTTAGPKGVTSKSVVTDTDGDSGVKDRNPGEELGKDTYLQLLVTQMANQDPTAPMDNTAMVAQLAQFSALEQMTNLNESFETLSGNVDQLNFLSAGSMLGKYVQGIGADKQPIKGTVRNVALDGSIVVLDVDGKSLPMTGLLTVSDHAPETTEKSVRGRGTS